MFTINDDMSIYLTRGDVAFFAVTAEDKGEKYTFQSGDVVRFKVTERKSCESVMLEKDFPVTKETEVVNIYLTEEDTKIGDIISKPTDFWYEVELNPFTNPQTILGYDEDGAKILKLFPEGGEVEVDEEEEITEEDIPVVDEELDLTSEKPVQNQAIARAITELSGDLNTVLSRFNNIATLKAGSTSGDAELLDIRVGASGEVYSSAGNAVRAQVGRIINDIDTARDCAETAKTSMIAAGISEENAKNSELKTEEMFETAKEFNEQTKEMIEENNKRLGFATFEMDENGNLTYTDDTHYEFTVDDEGLLNYVVAQ